MAEAGDDLAGIFATPFKHDAFTPQALLDPAYARRARALCDQHDALLIVDDVRAAGFGCRAIAVGPWPACSRICHPGAR